MEMMNLMEILKTSGDLDSIDDSPNANAHS